MRRKCSRARSTRCSTGLETERRESARRALGAQEAERLRIARELHDEVGQTLTAVALQVDAPPREPRRVTPAGGDRALLHGSLDDVRRIARELRPEALDDLGLTDAMIALCLRVERQGSIAVLREFEGNLPQLTEEAELALPRGAGGVTNASATRAPQRCRPADQSEPCLTVQDDGRGLGEEQGG